MTTSPTNAAGDLVTDAAVVEFAKWAIRESALSGSDLDGGSVQEKAVDLGLLVETVYDPETHGPSDVGDPGMPWFVFSPALAASPAHATGAAMRERIAAFLKDRDEAFVMTAEQTDAERLASADEIICLAALSSPAQEGEAAQTPLQEFRSALAFSKEVLAKSQAEGEAAPVRTDADGEPSAFRLAEALAGLSGQVEEALGEGAREIIDAAVVFVSSRPDPSVQPEGETGPAVAEPVAWLVKGNGWEELFRLEADAERLAATHAAKVTPLFAALTVSPSPSERDQHQGEAGGWQPIETVPRDGSEVVLFFPTYREDKAGVYRWRNITGPEWEGIDGWSCDVGNDDDDVPTLWHPLPPPPTAALSTPEAVPVADKREGGEATFRGSANSPAATTPYILAQLSRQKKEPRS